MTVLYAIDLFLIPGTSYGPLSPPRVITEHKAKKEYTLSNTKYGPPPKKMFPPEKENHRKQRRKNQETKLEEESLASLSSHNRCINHSWMRTICMEFHSIWGWWAPHILCLKFLSLVLNLPPSPLSIFVISWILQRVSWVHTARPHGRLCLLTYPLQFIQVPEAYSLSTLSTPSPGLSVAVSIPHLFHSHVHSVLLHLDIWGSKMTGIPLSQVCSV